MSASTWRSTSDASDAGDMGAGGAMGGPRRDESSRGLAGAAGAGAGSGKAAGRRGGAAGAGGAMGAGGAATVATFVTSAAAARGSGESGAGPLPFFRLRRLRPLLPVVFCGIGRTADAPKGFAIPAGRRLMEQRRSWRNAVGVPRALAEAVAAAASAAGSRALYGRPAQCVDRCVGLCGRGAARSWRAACLLTRVLRRARIRGTAKRPSGAEIIKRSLSQSLVSII